MIVSRAIAGGGSAARLNDRQNAVRARETVRVAAGICSADADPLEREQAIVVAEAQIAFKQIRRTRAQIVEQLSHVPQIWPRHAGDACPPG
jgi:hypothetical protein